MGARRRAAEVDGIDRNFVSPEAFERGLARGDYAYDSNDCWPPAFLAEHGHVEPEPEIHRVDPEFGSTLRLL